MPRAAFFPAEMCCIFSCIFGRLVWSFSFLLRLGFVFLVPNFPWSWPLVPLDGGIIPLGIMQGTARHGMAWNGVGGCMYVHDRRLAAAAHGHTDRQAAASRVFIFVLVLVLVVLRPYSIRTASCRLFSPLAYRLARRRVRIDEGPVCGGCCMRPLADRQPRSSWNPLPCHLGAALGRCLLSASQTHKGESTRPSMYWIVSIPLFSMVSHGRLTSSRCIINVEG